MSNISRRSLLGYTGTATAATLLTTVGSAQAADTGSGIEYASGVNFPNGTEFSGSASLSGIDGEMTFTFSIKSNGDVPTEDLIAPVDVANVLNDFATTRGWSPITFYGTPAAAPLT
ncbi:hypothetical protein [Streptomyces sp. NBC_01643]|uniref:hypothetical protein n=1 Tax=Streptomyces sp. NBC_01643 TaxID=2975906 RepID=UPI002F906B90|nr:hypothetical protein OHB03_47910 [Streptomyces sp. NBC_01643]